MFYFKINFSYFFLLAVLTLFLALLLLQRNVLSIFLNFVLYNLTKKNPESAKHY